jgi:hypothetical protein
VSYYSRHDAGAARALVYGAATVLVVGFQVALALGAPWGAYAMGGKFLGRWPARMRAAAIVEAVVLSALAAIVWSRDLGGRRDLRDRAGAEPHHPERR